MLTDCDNDCDLFMCNIVVLDCRFNLGEARCTCVMLMGRSVGKKQHGRHRWKDNIAVNLKAVGFWWN
jgi:hypothetical protein